MSSKPPFPAEGLNALQVLLDLVVSYVCIEAVNAVRHNPLQAWKQLVASGVLAAQPAAQVECSACGPQVGMYSIRKRDDGTTGARKTTGCAGVFAGLQAPEIWRFM